MEQKNKTEDYQIVDTGKQQRDSRDLWKMCFGDTEEFMDNYFSWRLKENQILSLYDDEIMTSMIHLNPYSLIFSGQEIQADYIVGVATRPEYRKKGLMRNLLTAALNTMYGKGHGFTFLMPASDKIYLPFDFRYIYKQRRRRIQIKADDLPAWVKEREKEEIQAAAINKKSDSSIYKEKTENIRVKELDSSDLKELHHLISFVNKILALNEEVYTKRDAYYYKRLQADMKSAGGNVLLFYDDGEIIGCTSYMLEENRGEITESIIKKEYTQEIIRSIGKVINTRWNDPKSLYTGNDQRTDLEITFLESEFMEDAVLEDAGFLEQKKPIIMGRIVNLFEFMKNLTAREALSITIKVLDPIIEENHGVWEFHFSKKTDDRYFCDRMLPGRNPELTLDIGTFTEIFMGYRKITEFSKKGLTGETLEKLNKINFIHKVFINEIV